MHFRVQFRLKGGGGCSSRTTCILRLICGSLKQLCSTQHEAQRPFILRYLDQTSIDRFRYLIEMDGRQGGRGGRNTLVQSGFPSSPLPTRTRLWLSAEFRDFPRFLRTRAVRLPELIYLPFVLSSQRITGGVGGGAGCRVHPIPRSYR